MHFRRASCGVFIMALLSVAGCSSLDETTATESSSTETSQEETSPSRQTEDTPTLAEGEAPTEAVAPQGANAAPNSSELAMYDSSQGASDNYLAWLQYEINSQADYSRDFEAEAYPDGVFVCVQLRTGSSIDTIESTLSGVKGWSGTGAAAIVKGALYALCPWSNQGYTTYFDDNVTTVSNMLATDITWTDGVPPPFYEIGYFAKTACDYLQENGSADGLENFLHSFRVDPQLQATHAGVFISYFGPGGSAEMDQLLRQATNDAVFGVCLGDHAKLNGYWTLS